MDRQPFIPLANRLAGSAAICSMVAVIFAIVALSLPQWTVIDGYWNDDDASDFDRAYVGLWRACTVYNGNRQCVNTACNSVSSDDDDYWSTDFCSHLGMARAGSFISLICGFLAMAGSGKFRRTQLRSAGSFAVVMAVLGVFGSSMATSSWLVTMDDSWVADDSFNTYTVGAGWGMQVAAGLLLLGAAITQGRALRISRGYIVIANVAQPGYGGLGGPAPSVTVVSTTGYGGATVANPPPPAYYPPASQQYGAAPQPYAAAPPMYQQAAPPPSVVPAAGAPMK